MTPTKPFKIGTRTIMTHKNETIVVIITTIIITTKVTQIHTEGQTEDITEDTQEATMVTTGDTTQTTAVITEDTTKTIAEDTTTIGDTTEIITREDNNIIKMDKPRTQKKITDVPVVKHYIKYQHSAPTAELWS